MSYGKLEAFGSMDWGFNAYGVHLWWICLPDGAYHIAREYKFRQMTAEQVGKRIHDETRALGLSKLRYIACDPAMWAKTGAGRGESIAETLSRLNLPVRKSDNDRVLGWLRVHEFLRPMADNSRPYLTIDPGCTYLIRSLPSMVCDENDLDDIDTKQDDHAVDALRYGAMSRPRPTVVREAAREPVVGSPAWWRTQAARESRQGVLA